MPLYSYLAKQSDGRSETGILVGSNAEEVVDQLTRRGLVVEQVEVARSPDDPLAPPRQARKETPRGAPPESPRSAIASQVLGPIVGKVGLSHLQFFFRQLATMLEAGLSPASALETLARQTTSGKLRTILAETRDFAAAGQAMTAGFERYPEVFTPLMTSMIRVGEQGGFLPKVLSDLADYVQRDIELRNMIRRETAYPKLVVVASIVIILAANGVIHSVAPGSPGLSSPLTTLGPWLYIVPLAVAVFLYVRVGLQNPAIRNAHDSIMLALPYVGPMIRGFAMAKFGRALGALYGAGVPLPEALRLASDASGNEALRARVHPASAGLREGGSVTEALRAAGVFSPIVIDMTATGEATGNLDQMLVKAAEFYEGESETRAKQAAVALGILAFLCVAAYVAYVIVGFYSGIGSSYGRAIEGA